MAVNHGAIHDLTEQVEGHVGSSGCRHAVAVEPAVHRCAFDAVNWLVAEYRQKLAREHVIDAATRRRLVPDMAFHLPGIGYKVSKQRHRIGIIGLLHSCVFVDLSITAPCAGLFDTHQVHGTERMAPRCAFVLLKADKGAVSGRANTNTKVRNPHVPDDVTL